MRTKLPQLIIKQGALLVVAALVIGGQASVAQGLSIVGPDIRLSAMADSLEVTGPEALGSINISPVGASMVPFQFSKATPGLAGGPTFILVSPSSGVAPANVGLALNPNVVPYLPPGGYTVLVSFAVPGQPATAGAGIFVDLTLVPQPPPSITSIVGAATLQQAISPGDLVSILGAHLGTPPVSAQYNDAGLYPTTLGNTTVTFNGVAAPLLYVSSGQINAVVPYAVAGQKTVNVVVTHNQRASQSFSSAIQDASPGIFTVNERGGGQGAIINADSGTANSVDNPAPKGSNISIFATGGGVLNQTVQDGSIVLIVLEPPFFIPAAPVSLTIGGQPTKVLYAGAAPYEMFGMLQVNAVVPTGIGSGPQPVVLTIGKNNNASQQVTVNVQ